MGEMKANWQVTRDLIRKYKISSTLLAEVLGMNRTVCSEKLHEKRTYHFTDAEKEKINHYLVCMGKILVGELGK